jgi:hypothetical protein
MGSLLFGAVGLGFTASIRFANSKFGTTDSVKIFLAALDILAHSSTE